MKHSFYNGKAINLKKMIQLYFLCKDFEMKLIDLQLHSHRAKEQKDYQNLLRSNRWNWMLLEKGLY